MSDFEMALHQNKAETTEVIREARAHCEATVRDAEACCAVVIREAEVCCGENAYSIQQLHSDGMQHLEKEALEEEEKDCQSFLATCTVALHVCPLDFCGILSTPSNILTWEHVFGCPPNHSPQAPLSQKD